MPTRGIFKVHYYSGGGEGHGGCHPYPNFRKSLLNLVLIDEAEVVESDIRGKPRDPKYLFIGERCFLKNKRKLLVKITILLILSI